MPITWRREREANGTPDWTGVTSWTLVRSHVGLKSLETGATPLHPATGEAPVRSWERDQLDPGELLLTPTCSVLYLNVSEAHCRGP